MIIAFNFELILTILANSVKMLICLEIYYNETVIC
jgi:hypothetical protein